MIFIPRRKDLTGKQFDELTVIEMLWNYKNKHRTYCRCIGIDNNEYIVRQDALMSGTTHTVHGACSGGISEDISGQKFGRLTAIKKTKERASNGGIKWKCICECGNIIYPTISNLKRGHTKSCGCLKEDFIESTKLNAIGKRYGKLTIIEDIQSTKSNIRNGRKVKCVCDCGNEIIRYLSDITTGHTSSCGCSFMSKGENYIKCILDNLHIEYVQQMRFYNCRNKRPLPFDFYLPKYKTCIEYDGEQHEIPVRYWGGKKGLLIRQKNDSIKTKYCNDNNIKLIRINHRKTEKEIKELILNLTSPATITV